MQPIPETRGFERLRFWALSRDDQVARLLLLFGIAIFLSSVRPGLDSEKYLRWSSVVAEADIGKLPNDVVGPQGIRVFQWSAGPGLILAPFRVLGNAVGIDEYGVLTIVGGILGLAFWCVLFQTFKELTDCRQTTWFCLAVAFLATPLGYYSRSISSETLSLLPSVVLTHQSIRIAKGQSPNWFLTTAGAGMLLIIRPYLGAYAWPAIFAGILFEWKHATRASKRRLFVATILSTIVIATSLAQIFVVNRWMTGDYLQSPYQVGDETYAALDIVHPRFISNVLFDPFHGLLPYHPLVGIGVVGLLLCLVFARTRRNDSWNSLAVCVLVFSLLAIAVNVWFQGSWQYWWLGTSSFGMRGLVLPSLAAVTFLALVLTRLRNAKLSLIVKLAAFACSLWSFLLLMQGPSNFTSFSEMLLAQMSHVVQLPFGLVPVGIAVVMLSVYCLSINELPGIILSALVSIYLVDLCSLRTPSVTIVAWMFALAFIAFQMRRWLSLFVVPLFTMAMISFIPLYVSTQFFGPPHSTNYSLDDPKNVHNGDLIIAYRAMRAYSANRPDFATEARRIESFLRRRGVDIPKVQPIKERTDLWNRYRQFRPLR